MVAVECEALQVRYGATVAVDAVTWSADTGTVTAVLGPNGAGKTSTIECLEGLRRPSGGRARVLGVDPWQADANHRGRVGVMLQDGGLPNTVTPRVLLDHLAELYADPIPPAQLRQRLDIDALGSRSIRRLSGGERARVALAAAIIGRPEVVFLDEPTAGLDPHARRDTWSLVRGLAEDGAAVVVTTHSFEEAERIADRLVIMAAGAVVAAGTVADVEAGDTLEAVYFRLTEGRKR